MIQNEQNAWQKQLEEARLAGMQEGYQKYFQIGVQLGRKELSIQILRLGLADITTIATVTGEREDEIRSWMQ